MLKYGSLFSGTGGLDLGVQSVLGGETAWFCEFDKAPSKILAHHWPDVPNLGDITKVDWSQVEPVDVLTGGSPCQDLSHAGKRAGMSEGTRSNLWVQMREAIAALRPRLIVWENVRGALSAEATSDLEPCPGCMGDPGDGRVVLRALGRVLGDLADLGYDARWYGLRAADVGAAHGRFRVFLFATPADTDGAGRGEHGRTFAVRPEHAAAEHAGTPPDGLTLLPTPEAKLGSSGPDYARRDRPGAGGDSLHETVGRLLPTPSVADGLGGHLSRSGARSDELLLPGVAKKLGEDRLLPTPAASDPFDYRRNPDSQSGKNLCAMGLRSDTNPEAWGDYAAAIARWEHVIGRPAPDPTETGTKGNPRLSPGFVEFLMGLPAGHVTDVGITRNESLKALGNGVVPQQAAAATRAWLEDTYQVPAGAPAVDVDGPLLPTPNGFHMGNTEQPDEWRKRRADVFKRTGTRHGPALSVVALSIEEGKPLTPDNYMPEED